MISFTKNVFLYHSFSDILPFFEKGTKRFVLSISLASLADFAIHGNLEGFEASADDKYVRRQTTDLLSEHSIEFNWKLGLPFRFGVFPKVRQALLYLKTLSTESFTFSTKASMFNVELKVLYHSFWLTGSVWSHNPNKL